MDWVILTLIGLIAASAGTLSLLVWDWMRKHEDEKALDDFDRYFEIMYGRKPTYRDYIEHLEENQ